MASHVLFLFHYWTMILVTSQSPPRLFLQGQPAATRASAKSMVHCLGGEMWTIQLGCGCGLDLKWSHAWLWIPSWLFGGKQNIILGGGNSNIFLILILFFWEMIQFDEHNIFQMGWFNHQLVIIQIVMGLFFWIETGFQRQQAYLKYWVEQKKHHAFKDRFVGSKTGSKFQKLSTLFCSIVLAVRCHFDSLVLISLAGYRPTSFLIDLFLNCPGIVFELMHAIPTWAREPFQTARSGSLSVASSPFLVCERSTCQEFK